MFPALLALQVLTSVLVLMLLLRRPPAAAAPDPKLQRLLEADLPALLARADERAQMLERVLQSELSQQRQQHREASSLSHEANHRQAEVLRAEVLQTITVLGQTLRSGLDALRGDHRTEADRLRSVTEAQLASVSHQLAGFAADIVKHQAESREALHLRLHELTRTNGEHQELLRGTVEQRLDRLNDTNTAKLEEMRLTVDEKLHATLQTRLTESFGQVTEHLTKVHTGLGEMTKLSAGVNDLSRIFTNVKSRGGFAEVQLGMLLSQMLAPAQFSKNVRVKPNSAEIVEYAVKLPTPQGETLLPIDAKFPREAWERLESAYDGGTPAEIAGAGKAFENAIRTEGKRICEKYIAPPATANFAVMFLPTEGLYAEVMRRDGLQAELQQSCRVTIAGPSTLSALLNSFQMGFHMLHLQRKGDEVWKVLAGARKEFGHFEALMGSMEKQVGTVQNTIEKLNTRTRAIHRSLRDVSLEEGETMLASGQGRLAATYDTLLPGFGITEDA